MRTVILLGGSGHIGQHLMREWLQLENDVRFVSVSRRGRPESVLPELKSAGISWLKGDAANLESSACRDQCAKFISSKKKGEEAISGSGLDIDIVRPSLVYGDRKGAGAMVAMMKFSGVFCRKMKPVTVTDLSHNIIGLAKSRRG